MSPSVYGKSFYSKYKLVYSNFSFSLNMNIVNFEQEQT